MSTVSSSGDQQTLIDDPLIHPAGKSKGAMEVGKERCFWRRGPSAIWMEYGWRQELHKGGLLNPKTNLKIPLNLPFEQGVLERGMAVLYLGKNQKSSILLLPL